MTQYFPVSGDISKSGWLIFSIREVLDTAAARRESAQARNFFKGILGMRHNEHRYY